MNGCCLVFYGIEIFLVKDCRQTLWSDYNNNPKKLTYLWYLSTIPYVIQGARPFTKGVSTEDTSKGIELFFSTASAKENLSSEKVH